MRTGVDESGDVELEGRDVELRELFDAFYPRLAGWTARLVDVDTAHDVATEAFTRLVQHWSRVDQPQPWLYMTAGNLVRDHWRRTGRERRALVRLRPVTETAQEPDAATRMTVRALVLALPDRLREPVLLHYFADLPVRQVAAVTGRAEGTVKRDLYDARARMAQQLGAGT